MFQKGSLKIDKMKIEIKFGTLDMAAKVDTNFTFVHYSKIRALLYNQTVTLT